MKSFQDRVFDFAVDCFGQADATNPEMRAFRFLEEAIEMGQACGCSKEAVLRVVDYVYGRPIGEIYQEAGGTLLSLAVLCHAHGLPMEACGEQELQRVLQNVEKIRARHVTKPDFSQPPAPQVLSGCAVRAEIQRSHVEQDAVCTCFATGKPPEDHLSNCPVWQKHVGNKGKPDHPDGCTCRFCRVT